VWLLLRHAGAAAFLAALLIGLPACGPSEDQTAGNARRPAPPDSATVPESEPQPDEATYGRLEVIGGYNVLTLEGTPEQMGTAAGRLVGATIRRVVRAVITDGIGRDPEAYRNILAGSEVMESHQAEDYLLELKALAKAAQVPYQDLLLLQYFGDVRRSLNPNQAGSSSLCTSFAILPPHTKDDACIVGRNFDYFDQGVGEYASLLIYYRPEGKIPFVTVTWAGITNGWTLLNRRGVVVSNNTAFAGSNSLEGISTCFLMRRIAESVSSLDEGIEIVRKARRSCATNLLIASGNPAEAAIIEFDCRQMDVRRSDSDMVGADNSFKMLYQPELSEEDEGLDDCLCSHGRLATVYWLLGRRSPDIDVNTNLAGASGVPIRTMNLHSAMIDATHLRLRIAMGRIPACELAYQAFRLSEAGLVSDGAPMPAATQAE
jgi:hypothetical protein